MRYVSIPLVGANSAKVGRRMAHDGNIQRDTPLLHPDPSDDRRPKEAEQATVAPETAASTVTPLPRFNMVPRPGAKKAAAPKLLPPPPPALPGRTAPLAESPQLQAQQQQANPPAAPVDLPALPPVPPPAAESTADTPRRTAKRRPAGPPRARIAANDDAPSIGGLIFSLQQKPSNKPFMVAAAGSGVWLALGAILAWAMLSAQIAQTSFAATLASPTMVIVVATIFLPIALF